MLGTVRGRPQNGWVTTTTRPPSPAGAPLRRAVTGLLAAVAVAVAGAAAWRVAGSPPDGAGTAAPACPPSLAAGLLAAGRGGVPDRLVPVPLPQPRGPVVVRICSYPSGVPGSPLERSVSLDPPRTAALVGLLDSPPTPVAAAGTRPPDCPATGAVTVLVFRYTGGLPLVAEVDAGPCALVSTSARVERGRADVVRTVAEALAG